jgi:putative ABC transport system permease protein
MTMARLVLKNVADKWIRFLLTALSVVLGVGFVVATFVITDGLRASFDELAENIAGDVDLQVRTFQEFGDDFNRPSVDPAVIDTIEAVPGVRLVEGQVFDVPVEVQLDDGTVVGSGGAGPGFHGAFELSSTESAFLVTDGPYAGRAPEGDGEFVINLTAAEDDDLVLGESYDVAFRGGLRPMTLVGAFYFGSPTEDKSIANSLIALDPAVALEFLGDGNGYSLLAVVYDDGADPAATKAAVDAVLPAGLESVTRDESIEEGQEDFGEFADVFQTILLVFALITLFVSAFIISNTFSIVIHQRLRELGLLRALGASGGQITGSVLGEALVVGVVATALGIGAGIGIAAGLRAILDALGAGFPAGPLPIAARTIVIAVVMGLGVTLLSALAPGWRARRVSPMAALRDEALGVADPRRRPLLGWSLTITGVALWLFSFGAGLGVLLLAPLGAIVAYFGASRLHRLAGRFGVLGMGLVLLLVAAVADFSTSRQLYILGAGALITFFGVNLVSPLFARQITGLIGRSWLGVLVGILFLVTFAGTGGALFGVVAAAADGNVGLAVAAGVGAAFMGLLTWLAFTTMQAPFQLEGRMARLNAGRTPRRTSSTAAALMIGLALVGGVTVVGSSLKATFTDIIDTSAKADWYVCEGQCGFGFGFSDELADGLSTLPEVQSAVAYKFIDSALKTADGNVREVFTADLADFGDHLDTEIVAGTSAGDAGSVLVYDELADELGVAVGDLLPVTFSSGTAATLRVTGIYSDNSIPSPAELIISNEAAAAEFPLQRDAFISVVTADGVDDTTARAALEAATAEFPDIEVRDKEEFKDSQAGIIDQFLAIINVFLGLALVIALVGIANTLALSVFERTREIGLLRAVGATRRQTSMLIRWEGAIIATFGGILGMAVGVLLGVVAVVIIPNEFIAKVDVPVLQLVIYIAVAALAGLLAAWLPARRAAKLNILDAIATE